MNQNEHITDEDGLLHYVNFGFLDWDHLENWKPNEQQFSPRFMKTSSLNESRSVRVSLSRNKKNIQQTPNGSPLNSSSSTERLPPRVRRSIGNDLPPGNEYSLKEEDNDTSSSSSSAAAADLFHSVNRNWKKSTPTTNRLRSSPLRRFLDPFVKPKGVVHSAEKVHKSKLDSRPNHNELLHIKKHRSSNVQALLQLTLKNGIPFFKLAVENTSDILAAAVKKLPSGEDDTSLIYAFYSVHEAKKKSGGWIYQSSKEKGYFFEHNIVGQMKINSSYHAEFSGPEKGLYVVRESVLYSTEHIKHETLDCMLEDELAAIIVKNLSDGSCGDITSSKTTIVVLPDCVHIWPNRGSRSTLITRWRSGGSCDCGGWDVGCQFHVLSCHQNESNHLDLCLQVGHKSKCSFRLVSVTDGLYSLEYDPSMSLLQAFSICVAVVSSHKLTHIFEV